MRQSRFMINPMRRGFSLLEVLFTVLIVAVLAAVAIPLYQNSTKSAGKKTCQNNIQAIANAETRCLFEKQVYVSGTDLSGLNTYGLATQPVCPDGIDTYSVVRNSDGTYTIKCSDTADGHDPDNSVTLPAPP